MSTNEPDIAAEKAHLDELREQIDELKDTSAEELVDPVPSEVEENLPTPEPTDPIGADD